MSSAGAWALCDSSPRELAPPFHLSPRRLTLPQGLGDLEAGAEQCGKEEPGRARRPSLPPPKFSPFSLAWPLPSTESGNLVGK